MVFNVAPRLPQLPALKGKFIKPFYSLFRSPDRPDRENVFKVSTSAVSRSTDVCRSRFDVAASTAGSIDPMDTVGRVSGWLRGLGEF